MRSFIQALLIALIAGSVAAQDPKPVGGQPPQKSGTTEVQDPKTGTAEAGRQDPKKQEAGEQDPKKQGEKPGVAPGERVETTEVDLPENQPLPDTADPADLRAMRSAQEMVSAERRLRARIKAGKIKDADQLLSFEEVSSWPYEDGLKGMPKAVRELDAKQVVMIGFMLPIDEVEDIKEFLLVQSLWACCYGQPPDINGIVRVVMKGDRRCDYQFDPIMVTGTFEVEATLEDGYCIDIFQLHATGVTLLR